MTTVYCSWLQNRKLNVLKEAISCSAVPQSIHLLRSRPLPYLLGFGLVINHTVLSIPNCKNDHVTQAWPIMLPPRPLSPQVVCDGHKANQSLSMRSDLLLEPRQKKMTSVKDSVWLGSQWEPPFLLPRAKLRRSNLSQVTVLERELNSYCPVPGFSCT